VSVLARDISCQQAVELVTDYLEDTLSRGDRKRFERHLEKCDGCEGYLAQIREVIQASGSVGPEDLDAATLDGLVQLFREYEGDKE